MNDNKIQIIKDDEIDFRALFQMLWNDRKRIVLITFLFTIMGVIYALIQTPLYKSTISIYPSDDGGGMRQMAELRSMASAFGISQGSQKALDISEILSSRSLQKKLIYHEWNSENWDKPVNLITYWEIDNTTTSTSISLNPIQWIKSIQRLFISNKDEELNLNFKYQMFAIEELSERIKIEKSETGLLYRISVWMEEKYLASDIANMIYVVLVEFNTMSHTNKARMNRVFIQERLEDVNIALEDAEESLKIFREKNRSVVESPQLQLELGRLARDVELQTHLFITLQEQLELSKIKELDETPTLTILDQAVPPLYKDKPRRKRIVIIASFLGAIGAVACSLLRHVYRANLK
jgi:uncharacterized protein involved in exopolysaccharide biosynthesis